MADDTITTKILLDAVMALKSLADLTNATASFNKKIEYTRSAVKSAAKEWGVGFQQAKQTLQGLDSTLSGVASSSTVFGGAGQDAWKKVGDSAVEAGEKTKKGSGMMAGGINLVRLALHVLATSAIFAVIGAFTKLFSMAITGLRELETATYNLVGAEKVLSEQGVDITPKGLDKMIEDLQTLDPLLSKIQASELVSRVSRNVAPQVGFDATQIKQFSEAVAILAIQNKGLGYSFEEVEAQISNAFLTGKVSQSINKLGIKINDQIVRDEALRLGLVKTADEFDNLTGKMESNIKAQAMLSILVSATDKERAHLPEYFKTADAAFGVFQARLQDILTILGADFGPIIKSSLELFINILEDAIVFLKENEDAIQSMVSGMASLVEFSNNYRFALKASEDTYDALMSQSIENTLVLARTLQTILGVIEKILSASVGWATSIGIVVNSIRQINPVFDSIFRAVEGRFRKVLLSISNLVVEIFQGNPVLQNIFGITQSTLDSLKQGFETAQGYYSQFAEGIDTPTTPLEDLQEGLESIDASKAQDELKDLLKDLENLQEKINEKEADYQTDLGRFDEDALTDRNRAVEDYNLNVLQATRAYNLQKKEANEKYRQKELEDERKFQESMRKLQEDFLYNLEDALRERDARQVLRLIDKYNMEKEALINENALRKEASAENQRDEEEDRKAQFDEKLRVMAEEQALKLARMDEDSALKRQRMEEDHFLEMARLREQLDERIREAADKMAEEYGVNAEGAQAIYDLLAKYYGTDGALAALTQGGYNAMLANASGFLTSLFGIIAQYNAALAGAAGSSGSSGNYNWVTAGGGAGEALALAEGGQFIATRPQKILVGEGGQPELVQVTPLSQIASGQAAANGAGGINGLGGANGQTQISVMVDLSPDLEARVINRSLEGAADVIAQVRRGKQ